ncbi:MAG: DUF1311 domain-containing protein [Alphaproteobacteria bacterium]|nr:DUF1311 domain-containing protein [Alphaproteobacteria bacterium]
MRVLVLIFAAALATLPASTAGAAAIDCLKAGQPVEHLVCDDPELLRLDGLLNQAFAKARKATKTPKPLVDEQRAWAGRRGPDCGLPPTGEAADRDRQWSAAGCVAGLYRARLAELGLPQPEPAPPRPADFPHPLCVEATLASLPVDEPARPVPLKACGRGFAHVPVSETRPGLFGSATASQGESGWFGYRAAARLGDGRDVLVIFESGGGTGVFSEVVALRRVAADGDILMTAESLFAGGDRCNGGIETAEVTRDGALLVESYATALELLELAGVEPDDVDPTVPGCASCCLGRARGVVPQGGKLELVSVTLDSLDSLTGVAGPAACLSGLLRAEAPKLPHALAAAQVRAVGRRFRETCLAPTPRASP